MDEIILWFRDKTSDKIWGVVPHRGSAVVFWGRRGYELSFKLLTDKEYAKIGKKADKKRASGYRDVTFADLEEDRPGYRDEFDVMLTLTIVGENFRHSKKAL